MVNRQRQMARAERERGRDKETDREARPGTERKSVRDKDEGMRRKLE